jgi:hypothetical protein
MISILAHLNLKTSWKDWLEIKEMYNKNEIYLIATGKN